jgi:hypothetical protein
MEEEGPVVSPASSRPSAPPPAWRLGLGCNVETARRCPLAGASCTWGSCSAPGQGAATLPSGATATGVWLEGGLLQGPANVSLPDGSLLRGHFSLGCLAGLATLQEPGGGLLVAAHAAGLLAGGPVWLLLPGGEGALYAEVGPGSSLFSRSATACHS